MLERDGYPAGVPCWVDIEGPDPEAAMRFYSGLFGWEFDDSTPPGSSGRYFVARLRGAAVAGVGSPGKGEPSAPAWNTYVRVEDADAAAAEMAGAGGRVLTGPYEIPGAGRAAVCADPAGALFRIWEPKGHEGAERVNEPDTWNMSELTTHDPEAAKAFYGAVFGWEADPVDFGAETSTMWRLPGYGGFTEDYEPDIRSRQWEEGVPPGFEDAVGWMVRMPGDVSGEEGPRWSVTFAVGDVDAVAERAARIGGGVETAPFDVGDNVRLAVLRDPLGAVFAVNRWRS
ncbi:VOC family protein [Allosalinactinospora lopnorensis]|uniref:VOC family protein n=1 Tax=Allosalinactinospora lopnorensis TaxID=1352348 RepID=UPI000623F556|nr:VOC family protein [Allosalinactinospora lopnorensis]